LLPASQGRPNGRGTTPDDDRAHDPTRVLALSDGVFAIAITLFVLELQVPDLASGQSLRQALRAIRRSFIAFLISLRRHRHRLGGTS
jgi:uncharacterized membrane protein